MTDTPTAPTGANRTAPTGANRTAPTGANRTAPTGANRIDNITIVGGGTSGWMAAIMLATFMNGRRDGPPIGITLIESPNVPTVGVGEATVPGMTQLLMQLGIDEAEFFRRCNVSFKCGVRFSGWRTAPGGGTHDFIHPFNPAHPIAGQNPAYHFHRYVDAGGAADIVDGLVPNVALIDHHKGPREPQRANYEQAIGYSYHLDAGLFARYLRELSLARGVTHIADDVTEVKLDERGYVSSLMLDKAGEHPVQFVLDCTGFRGLIINQALGEPFEPWGRHLLCDRALPLQVDHVPGRPLEICTTATALGAGWVWNVPLYSRVGTGYVYSGAHRSDDEAWDEFRQYLTARGFQTPADPPRPIPMRIGRSRRGWVKNCVAVGLAGGFIEPLEATAIYAIDMTVRHFVHHFPDRDNSPVLAQRFNRALGDLYENVLEFVTMHYVTSDRPEPFWVAAREDIDVPDRLAENMALWKHVLPSEADLPRNALFDYWSYIFCLHAKGYFDGVSFPAEGSVARADWDRYAQELNGLKAAMVNHLPDHRALVAQIRGDAVPPRPTGVMLPGGQPLRPVITGLPGR